MYLRSGFGGLFGGFLAAGGVIRCEETGEVAALRDARLAYTDARRTRPLGQRNLLLEDSLALRHASFEASSSHNLRSAIVEACCDSPRRRGPIVDAILQD